MSESRNGHGRGGQATSRSRLTASAAMRRAAVQLAELLQRDALSVSRLQTTDDGWSADVEVVELARVPDTTSVMGSYRVQLDGDGELTGYERTRRYAKGQVDRR